MGISGYSSIIIVITSIVLLGILGSTDDAYAVPPDAVTDLTLNVASETQVDLSWTIPADNGSPITGYVIKSKLNGVTSTIETSYGDATTTSYSDITLSLGDNVTYRVAAINADGMAPFSNIPTAVNTSGLTFGEQILASLADIEATITQILADLLNIQTQIDNVGSGGIDVGGDLTIDGDIVPSADLCIGICVLNSVPAVIPLHVGYYNEGLVYYIITDTSDQTTADSISLSQGWKVELSPILINTTPPADAPVYIFTNGIAGNGLNGFQSEVFTSTIIQPVLYTAIRSHVEVTWNGGETPELLDSTAEIIAAETAGKITLQTMGINTNMPQMVWPGGQMPVRLDPTLAEDTPYTGGAQLLDIDTNNLTVTFVAHKGFGRDGSTIYYIITDISEATQATIMGVTHATTLAGTQGTPSNEALFQFSNGIIGPGPEGFQAGIAASIIGDVNYTPLWDIFMIDWNDPLMIL